MLILTLDEAAKVAYRFAKEGYGYDFIRSELEQKCYIIQGRRGEAIKELAEEIDIRHILDHIQAGDLESFLEDLKANILGQLAAGGDHV